MKTCCVCGICYRGGNQDILIYGCNMCLTGNYKIHEKELESQAQGIRRGILKVKYPYGKPTCQKIIL